MALQVASLYGVLSLDNRMGPALNSALSQAQGFGNQISGIGNRMTAIGAGVTAVTAPVGAFFMSSVNSARQFESNLLNVQAVTGNTNAEMDLLATNLQQMGRNSRQGENALSGAFYTIASAVQDTSSHMDILQASMMLADAGNADLEVSTRAVIGAMNSYQLQAEDAGFVSDILTRSVAMGQGTMNEFGSQMISNAGLASTLGISFDDLAAQTSFLTTQNKTVGEATTQLMGVMTAFLNPNSAMTEALSQMGYTSGSAAIESLGLQGAIELMHQTLGSTDAMVSALGSQEALQGSLGLLVDGYDDFRTSFGENLEGITATTAATQNQNEAYDILQSRLQGVSNTIGGILNPMIQTFLNQHVNPALLGVIAWMETNPQLTATIVTIGGALLVAGPILVGFGMLVSAAGAGITALSGAMTFLLGPFGLVILAIGGMIAWLSTQEGGLIGALQRAWTTAKQLGFILQYYLTAAIDAVDEKLAPLRTLIDNTANALDNLLNKVPGVEGLNMGLETLTGQSIGDSAMNMMNPMNMLNPFNMVTSTATNFVEQRMLNAIDGQRAAGGPVTAGRTYLVGERGPELFSPSRSGSISSNRDTAAMMSNGGGDGFTINGDVHIHATDVDDFTRQMQERRRRRS